MRKPLRFIVAFVLVIMMLAVLVGAAVAAPPAALPAKWTVMVYMSGDNDLEPYVVGDIETELAPTGSSVDVQVVALVDRGPGYDRSRGDWQTTEFFHVTSDTIADLAHSDTAWDENHADELNMGNPQTLIDFVTWTKTNYPADHYALYFWGHGWNWHPGWVMADDTSNDTLDYHEMKAAIPALDFIDVVGYDGCNMASIEILTLWHGHATALTSSQESVGAEGIQYDLVLAQLAATPNMSADAVAVATSKSATGDRTWSAVAVDERLDTLLNAVEQWSLALNNGLAANRSKYSRAFSATRSFWAAPMDKDLYDMAYEIRRLVSNPTIRNTSLAVMNAITDVVLLHERHVKSYSDAHGITIYHISKASEKDSDYDYYRDNVDFALQYTWDEFLKAYAQ